MTSGLVPSSKGVMEESLRQGHVELVGCHPFLITALIVLALLCSPDSAAIATRHQSAVKDGTELQLPPVRWAEVAAKTEEEILNHDGDSLLRYRVRKVDAKGEVIREVIESKEGNVARLIERDGQPLTAEENTAERQRLTDILDDPSTFLRHARRDEGSKTYAAELLRAMPKAMLWTYAPSQPQLQDAQGPAVVLDFEPNPSYKPSSLVTEALTGIAGRVWIDRASHCVTRIQGRTLHAVDFGWGGVLARIKEGGTVELDQRKVNDRRWLFSRLVEHISIREVLVHTVTENVQMTASNAQAFPAPLSYREAIQQLLALSVPTR